MISHLTGSVANTNERFIIISVGGVGYKVFTTPETIAKAKKSEVISLWTHLAVRENALDLYGFISKDDLAFFELLITISGIGPKTALGILNTATVSSLRQAITSGETAHLVKVSGIGKKIADKIVLELKGKLGAEIESDSGNIRGEVDALEALKALGYRHHEAREALKEVPNTVTDTGERIKAALKLLGK